MAGDFAGEHAGAGSDLGGAEGDDRPVGGVDRQFHFQVEDARERLEVAAEGGDPVGRRGPQSTGPLLLGLPLLDCGDLAVDALHPHRVPHPQGEQALQVGRQSVDTRSCGTALFSYSYGERTCSAT
ncbi:hypothetical protein AB0N23_00300 [Streptomyces sp. NPDC052644]